MTVHECTISHLFVQKPFIIKHVIHFCTFLKKKLYRINKGPLIHDCSERKYVLFEERGRETIQYGYCCTSGSCTVYLKDLEMCQVAALLLFIFKSLLCSLCDGSGGSLHTLHPPPSSLLLLSSLTSSLFEKALVEEMGATGKSLILQTEEQVPEIDARDALPCGSGARRTSPTRQRGT